LYSYSVRLDKLREWHISTAALTMPWLQTDAVRTSDQATAQMKLCDAR